MTQTDILTARQREALALVGEGLSTREIAARLGVTPRAGKAHVDTLRRKFGVDHKRQLIPIALEYERKRNEAVQ